MSIDDSIYYSDFLFAYPPNGKYPSELKKIQCEESIVKAPNRQKFLSFYCQLTLVFVPTKLQTNGV